MNLRATVLSGFFATSLLLAGCAQDSAPEAPRDVPAARTAPPEAANNNNAFEPLELSTEYHQIRVSRIAGGLEHPWAVAFLPDGGFLVTERPGRLNRISADGMRTRIGGVPDVAVAGQGGLLDVVLHPDYADNGWIYMTYSSGDDGETTTKVARARIDGDQLVDLEELFSQDRLSQPGRHYGSRIVWRADGTMLVSIGDRGAEPPRAQDPADHAGTVLRLNADGSVPDDNPFIGRDDVLPEVFSYGHRNIQGMVVDPATDKVWATEHGPRGGDELNLVVAGNNYGWPSAGLGRDYRTEEQYGDARSLPGKIDPVYEFLPTLAPSGLALLTTDTFPRWQGNLLAGGLRAERIRRLVIENDIVVHDEELITGKVGRIRDVREGPDGAIYVLTDHEDGGLYRIDRVN
ncbi:MAG: PQQ-dependent sugar dehydrogenase [Gammaproteobacteria bacterium]|nr:PQQ-dependent sugar dehydrogenase [Gammaproteobacteria bacterium]